MHPFPRGAAALVLVLTVGACSSVQTLRIGPDMFGQAEPPRDTAQSRMNVAAAAEASGRPEIALSMYAAAARQEPRNVEAQSRYAGALARSGNLPGARDALLEPLRRDGDNAVLLRALASVQLQSGKAAEAEALYARVLASKPSDVRAMDGRGVALDMLGRYDEAEVLHRAAQKAEPDNIRTANNLAVSLMLAGRPQEAAAVLEPFGNRSDASERVQTNLALAQTAGRGGAAPGGRSVLNAQASGADIDAVVQALGERSSAPAQPITLARSPMVPSVAAAEPVQQAVLRTQEDPAQAAPIVLTPVAAPVEPASRAARVTVPASVAVPDPLPVAALPMAVPESASNAPGPIVLNPVQPEPETTGAAAAFPH